MCFPIQLVVNVRYGRKHSKSLVIKLEFLHLKCESYGIVTEIGKIFDGSI